LITTKQNTRPIGPYLAHPWTLGRGIEEGEEGRNIVWKTWRGIKDVDPKGE